MKTISLDLIPELTANQKEIDRNVQAGRSAVISWAGLTRKSSGRVSEYLKRQGFDPEVIPKVIDSLKEDRTIDDERLARKIIQQRRDRQQESRLALASRLANMGIDSVVIEDVLASEHPFELDQQSAASVFHQRFGHLFNELKAQQDQLDALDFKRKCAQLSGKAARFLSTRGFSESIIVDTLRQAGLMTDGFE